MPSRNRSAYEKQLRAARVLLGILTAYAAVYAIIWLAVLGGFVGIVTLPVLALATTPIIALVLLSRANRDKKPANAYWAAGVMAPASLVFGGISLLGFASAIGDPEFVEIFLGGALFVGAPAALAIAGLVLSIRIGNTIKHEGTSAAARLRDVFE